MGVPVSPAWQGFPTCTRDGMESRYTCYIMTDSTEGIHWGSEVLEEHAIKLRSVEIRFKKSYSQYEQMKTI